MPLEIAAVNGLAENLRLQDHAAQTMKDHRHMKGALCLETLEPNQYLKAILFSTCKWTRRTVPRTLLRIS
jgi:hypothetical protein